ncbi:DUF421 domain-containing protein [Paenibacillus taiwanensis]|uniref:DUF421 domain-containing protein n=1 Tax=Paenibacillus taiwanensis TaxID=401638 RepID=UPI00040002C8|nr:DUF421 domain-containing protein [Paenibacillus taiwanensis]
MLEGFEIAIRTLVSVVVLFFLTKLLGKRQVSQLSLFEYITGITIGSIAAYISLDAEAKWYLGIISLVVWVAFSLGIEYLQIKTKKLRDFIDSKSTVLIKGGRILEKNLHKERITSDELMQQLRKNNAFRVADVEFAVMEPSGEINVLLKKELQPLTAKDLGIVLPNEKEPQIVIMDGKLLPEPLRGLGLDLNWLHHELEKVGYKMEEVFLGQVDSNKQLYVDLYDDQRSVGMQQQPNVQLTMLLKQCEAEVRKLTGKNEDVQLQQLYERFRADLERVVPDITTLAKK